jgi:hypothetical protein
LLPMNLCCRKKSILRFVELNIAAIKMKSTYSVYC